MKIGISTLAFAALALAALGCGDGKKTVDGPGAGGTGGIGGTGGQGGSGGTGGSGGAGGTGGVGGSGGSGVGGSGGSEPACGDGIVEGDEECDGAAVPESCSDRGFDGGTTGCTAACEIDDSDCVRFEDCTAPGDEDGDGNENCEDSDCATAFECPACGNGVVQQGEACDGAAPPGQSCADYEFDTGTLGCDPITCEVSTEGCRNIVCGDGTLEGTELCDDGNTVSGDGCSSDCRLEGNDCTLPRAIGDAHLDTTSSTWTVQGDTTAYRQKFGASCGNAWTQRDVLFAFTAPANGLYFIDHQAAFNGLVTVWDDACAAAPNELACATGPSSELVGLLANQTVHIVADGADPGIHEGPFTLSVEQRSICGDGTVQPAEECDFADTLDGDGCSSLCLVEPGWTCDGTGCEPPPCGNGHVDAGEQCDDGNAADDDGCSATCQLVFVPETEPNNTFLATGIRTAHAGTGANGSFEVDLWRLSTIAGTTYVVHTATAPDGSCGPGNDQDTRLKLYDDRQEIADEDGGGPGLCARLTFTADGSDYILSVMDGPASGGLPVYYFWLEAQ